ncbi:MAG: Oligopeptide-binding protein AppA precursor [bacterium ADurb.Bin212]|nr:MAG: Oligopeptide-binding protein AppA precursor [bacterium ADurb.Bin212]
MNPKQHKVITAISNFFKVLVLPLIKIFGVVSFLFSRLTRKEKLVFFILLSILCVLIIFESLKIYYARTQLVPDFGGEYTEVIQGDAKYFSPILAKTDSERAISGLIYSSLIKIDEKNQPISDLADSWQISEDGLTYTFVLKQGVTFHGGQAFSSDDIVATVSAIQDEANKSPLREMWSGVVVNAIDEYTVSFVLPKQYGPFIYNCNFKVISKEDVLSTLSANYNGTGPYRFVNNITSDDGGLEVNLESYGGYYAGPPLISKMKFIISSQPDVSEKRIKDLGVNAISSVENVQVPNFLDFTFTAGRNLMLIPNIRKVPFQDEATRKKILTGEKVEGDIKIRFVFLDNETQKQKAKEVVSILEKSGVKIESVALSVHDYAESLKKKDYNLLLYGYDWSYDLDLYTFWHSSQLDKNNFSGYSTKEDDIYLEDTRMILDGDERQKRYNDFLNKITGLSLVVDYGQKRYPLFISESVKNVEVIKCGRPEDRFNDIISWYINEKRVRKGDSE